MLDFSYTFLSFPSFTPAYTAFFTALIVFYVSMGMLLAYWFLRNAEHDGLDFALSFYLVSWVLGTIVFWLPALITAPFLYQAWSLYTQYKNKKKQDADKIAPDVVIHK